MKQFANQIEKILRNLIELSTPMTNQYLKIITLTTLLSYTYFFLEWLFFITKPSFLTGLSAIDNLFILFVAPLPLCVVCFFCITVLIIPSYFFKKVNLAITVPVVILGVLIFILVDNFTHTMFGFYSGSYSGFQRYSYVGLFVLILMMAYLRVSSWLQSELFHGRSTTIIASSILLPVIAIIIIIFKFIIIDTNIEENTDLAPLTSYPNILILSTDGLDAASMSAYNYSRPTTLFINSIINESLVSENSFSNNTHTTGSVAALLSGKLPTKTGVIFPPSIFNGIHIYQHFAGILKKHGYRNLDVGVPYYADSYDLNMRGAFDRTTFRNLENNSGFNDLPTSIRYIFSSELFFQESVINRIKSRILHVLSISDYVDPYKLVTETSILALTDAHRLEMLFDFINKNKHYSFFSHVHFMESHGPKFRPSHQFFSKDKNQNQKWMTDFYDDTVLSFDAKVRRISDFLKQNKLLNNTIIVVTSDHGKKWELANRIPLIIKFPNGSHSGQITFNTQRADIPPTLLEYLGLDKPQWMDGNSIISGSLNMERMIFVAKPASTQLGQYGLWGIANYAPPFYSLGQLAVIQCQLSYNLDLATRKISTSVIKDHTSPCDIDELITERQAYDLLIKHLEDANYDMSHFSEVK